MKHQNPKDLTESPPTAMPKEQRVTAILEATSKILEASAEDKLHIDLSNLNIRNTGAIHFYLAAISSSAKEITIDLGNNNVVAEALAKATESLNTEKLITIKLDGSGTVMKVMSCVTKYDSSSSGNNDDDPDEGSDGDKSNAAHSGNANSDELALEAESTYESASNATDNVFYANDPELLVLDQDLFISDGDIDVGTRATSYSNPTKAKKADDTSIEELEIYLETLYEANLNNDINSKAYEIEDAPSAEVLETYSAEVTFAGIIPNSNMIAA